MNTKIITFSGILALGVFLFFYYRKNPLVTKAYIGQAVISLEVAITPVQKSRGLGFRDSLPRNQGMIFAFSDKNEHPFWMMGMRFPLDFIWVLDNKVMEITENVPVKTDGKITTVKPKTPINKVIEINAGEVARLGIKVGDLVRIEN